MNPALELGLDPGDVAAIRFIQAIERPVATYFGLSEEDQGTFCLWLLEAILVDLGALAQEAFA